MPGCPIWLWTSSVLRSVWECQRRLSAGSQRWLPESEQAPPRPWLKAEKGKMRSSSWELWVKTVPSAPCVRRALPPVSISAVRGGGGERSFATIADASYFIKFAGEASRMAVFHLSRAARRRTWRQDSGVGNVNVAAGAREKKEAFSYEPPFIRHLSALFSFCRSTARIIISFRRLNHDPLWNRRVSPSSSRTHARTHAHRPLQWLFLLFDADRRSLRGYAQHSSL